MSEDFVNPSASMSDLGTRMEHLDHVRQLWQNALSSLKARLPVHRNLHEDNLIVKLTNALDLLDDHMAKDYNPWHDAKEINGLPPARMIEGGRGTPLRNPKGK
jgi:hypothetical protein